MKWPWNISTRLSWKPSYYILCAFSISVSEKKLVIAVRRGFKLKYRNERVLIPFKTVYVKNVSMGFILIGISKEVKSNRLK